MKLTQEQRADFERRLCERLGLDNLTTTGITVTVEPGSRGATVTWTGIRILPLEQLSDLFAVEP